jgi:hypothetical protein
VYEEERLAEAIRYSYKWESIFKSNLRYKKPFIINGYELNDQFDEDMSQMREPATDMADLIDFNDLSSDDQDLRREKLEKDKAH